MQLKKAEETHSERLRQKTEILHKNIKYYGGKTQEMIQELVSR